MLLNQLAEQCEENTDIEASIDLYERSVLVAEQCLAQLKDCKGRLVVLNEKVKDIIDE